MLNGQITTIDPKGKQISIVNCSNEVQKKVCMIYSMDISPTTMEDVFDRLGLPIIPDWDKQDITILIGDNDDPNTEAIKIMSAILAYVHHNKKYIKRT